jgi:deoxyribodipyrimidine photo-lyase
MVEPERIRALNRLPIRESSGTDTRYVLYWAQMNRRAEWNHALAHAAELANARGLPLLVYEGLDCVYPAANDRLHSFVLENVPDMESGVHALGAGYLFHARRNAGDPKDLLYRLAARAACVVSDDYPTFVAAAHNRRVPERIGVAYRVVDSSCIVPMALHEKREWAAYTIRPKIHRALPKYLKPLEMPTLRRPWDDSMLPEGVAAMRTRVTRESVPGLVAECGINNGVGRSPSYTGGRAVALGQLGTFLDRKLVRYAKESGQPSRRSTSGLSPYLHFGQISALEVALAAQARAEERKLEAAEFLEELIVRRELAFNFARFTENPESLAEVPDWCQRTMRKHASDARSNVYSFEEFESGLTHDPLWNAAQKELLLRGVIHGYYRMYWGKKIIEWSRTYDEALRTMVRLHDVYALDGRDPNTYTGILWCFGLHDRPWTERPVYGQLRCMTFEGMKRKTDVNGYLEQIGFLERTGKDPGGW